MKNTLLWNQETILYFDEKTCMFKLILIMFFDQNPFLVFYETANGFVSFTTM